MWTGTPSVSDMEKIAKKGTPDEQYSFAESLFYGKWAAPDRQKAFKYYTLAADRGNALARFRLAVCYQFGESIDKDEEKALHYFILAADQGYVEAQFTLAYLYRNQSPNRAMYYYTLAAEQGYSKAQNNLALCYEFGTGTEKDEKKAVYFYRLAADQKDPYALYNLGRYYTYTRWNPEKSSIYFLLAAGHGNSAAQVALGDSYFYGFGKNRDILKAALYYSLGADNGNDDAQYKLALYCKDTMKDINKAVNYLILAAERGHLGAQKELSRCYEKGEGVQTSKLKASEYSSKAKLQEGLWTKDHLGIYCRKNLNMIYAEEKPDCFPITENQATGNAIKLPDAASLLSGKSKREMRVEKNAYLKAKKPYKGTDPYIFLSYSHQNMDEALDIIAFLQSLEYNIWYDEGIDPGTEWDKTIAEHVKSCEVFLALLSEEYINSSNCKDELNYARDLNKTRVLIYLKNIELPDGMRMRLSRMQNIHKYKYKDQEQFYEKLLETREFDKCRKGK